MNVAPSRPLAGRAAIVTGSTSGIGRAIALELASAGADVMVHGRAHADRLAAVEAELRALGCATHGRLADLASQAAQCELVEAAFAWRADLSIWINNAGVDLLTGSARELSYDDKLARLWQVDVAATIHVTRLVGQRMATSAGGAIVNMGWDQAAHGMGGDSGELFATAKGAVMAFTKSVAVSLAPRVRVNCVAPGWIRTAWGKTASELWQQRAVRESQLGRWGDPGDVARAVRFLVSDDAAHLTGQILDVNGGPKAN